MGIYSAGKSFNYWASGIDDKLLFSAEQPLFRIFLQKKDASKEIFSVTLKDSKSFDILHEGSSAKIICIFQSESPPYSIEVEAAIDDNGGEALGSLSLKVEGDISVRQVQFPYIIVNDVNQNDSLMMSTSWGDSIPRPFKTIKEYCLGKSDFWVYDYVKCGEEDEVVYTYPSIMSMQYMALYNNYRNIYAACYGTDDNTRTFNAKVLGKTSLALSINHYPFLENGSFKSPECGFSILPGDWHSSADLYKSHMGDKFSDPDLPMWMKEKPWNGWVQIMMRLENQQPVFTYKDLPEIYKRISKLGMKTLHIAGWAYNGFDTLYPDYDIDQALGTKEELKAALDEIKSLGGHAILYTNGRLVDKYSDFYKNGGDRYVCLNEEGKPYIETYRTSAEFRIACPTCGEYRSYLARRIQRMLQEFGAHAVQIDQISCNYAYFCYDKSHSHTTPANNFLPGVEAELKQIRSMHKSIDKDFFVWCEGCHERFGQFYDVEQGHGEEYTWQIGESVPEQFHYTYPKRICTGISGSIQQLCHTFIQGKPFDFGISMLENNEFTGLVKAFVSIRNTYPEYYLNGIFKDNTGVEVTSGIRSCRIERADGRGHLISLWLPGAGLSSSNSAILKISANYSRLSTVFPDDIKISNEGKLLCIKWSGPVATIIIAE